MTICFYLFFSSSFYALLSVHGFASLNFRLLVFSFLKLEFWSCFANNRHAFVLFFVLNGVGADDSAQRSTLGCWRVPGDKMLLFFHKMKMAVDTFCQFMQ